jgi:uncharacterized protein
MTMVLGSIHIYPVKSLGGVSVPEVEVEPWGLQHDRRWLVVNPDGTVLTAREQRRMLGVTAVSLEDGAIMLTGLDGSTVQVEAPVDGELVPILMSRLNGVRKAGREADDWLARQLGNPVRLGWLDDPRRRTVSIDHGGQAGDPLNLADAGPLLLTTTASLGQLNNWLADDSRKRVEEPSAPMVMARFRPSVVVDGADAPFVEDTWRHVHIGSVEFRFAEQCDRCVLATIDPLTLISGKEPLRTLARHRRRDRKTWFGIRLIPVTTGKIHIGDGVSVR